MISRSAFNTSLGAENIAFFLLADLVRKNTIVRPARGLHKEPPLCDNARRPNARLLRGGGVLPVP